MLLAEPYSIATRMRSEAETLVNARHKVAAPVGAELKLIKSNSVKRANEEIGT